MPHCLAASAGSALHGFRTFHRGRCSADITAHTQILGTTATESTITVQVSTLSCGSFSSLASTVSTLPEDVLPSMQLASTFLADAPSAIVTATTLAPATKSRLVARKKSALQAEARWDSAMMTSTSPDNKDLLVEFLALEQLVQASEIFDANLAVRSFASTCVQ
jgi:hypothetical protein